jgi:putative methanogenesis marker protein 6
MSPTKNPDSGKGNIQVSDKENTQESGKDISPETGKDKAQIAETGCLIPQTEPAEEDGKITRMIILGPSANISTNELVRNLHMMEFPLTIKTTCYGAAISGEKEQVDEAINRIRKLDPYNIFTKDRGFPPGDPRRCRAKRGGAREGFHQLEKEFELLDDVSKALKNPRKVKVKKLEKISPDEFKKIAEECK